MADRTVIVDIRPKWFSKLWSISWLNATYQMLFSASGQFGRNWHLNIFQLYLWNAWPQLHLKLCSNYHNSRASTKVGSLLKFVQIATKAAILDTWLKQFYKFVCASVLHTKYHFNYCSQEICAYFCCHCDKILF